jgi:hypothetical protein
MAVAATTTYQQLTRANFLLLLLRSYVAVSPNTIEVVSTTIPYQLTRANLLLLLLRSHVAVSPNTMLLQLLLLTS